MAYQKDYVSFGSNTESSTVFQLPSRGFSSAFQSSNIEFSSPFQSSNSESRFSSDSVCIGSCSVCCIVTTLLMIFAFNTTGLVIGLAQPNATCYENQNIMSLSHWLVLVTSISMASGGSLILLILLGLCSMATNNIFAVLSSIPLVIFLVFSGLFSFIMNIIGIIELSYQFPSCKNEAHSICVMVIIIVVINTMSIYNSCCVNKLYKKKTDYVEL